MISNFLNIFYQTLLFILLFVQASLIYLSLSFSGIPVSKTLIQKYLPQNVNLSTKEVLFFLPYHIKLIEPKFTPKADNLFQIDSPEIFVSWQPSLKNLTFNDWRIHSYSGKVSSKLYPNLLEINRLNLVFKSDQIQNARLLLRSDDKIVYLDYSADKYLVQGDNTSELKESINSIEVLSPIIEQDSPLYTIIKALHASKNTYIECFINGTADRSHTLSTILSSEEINVFGNEVQSLQIQSQHSLDSLSDIVFFQADNLSNPKLDINFDSIRGKLILDKQMQIDSIEIDSGSTLIKNAVLDSISAQVFPRNNGNYLINGILFSKDHFLNVLSDYNINAHKNAFLIKAYLDINELQKDYIPQVQDIEIQSPRSIFANTEIILDNNLRLIEAQGHIQGEVITANKTPFQYLRSDFQWINKRFIANTILRINQRKSSINTDFDAESGNYIFTLNGSTFSSDFNSIFPKWWQNTFKDFSYTNNTKCFHDFAFYGTIESPIPDYFMGSVHTENIEYKSVPVKYGDVLVKGKNYCTEITLRDLQTQKGHAVGVIKITIKPDGFKKPESVRTKLKSELTFKTAEKIFGNDIKQILSNFDSPYIHKVNFESAFFHPHYTQHNNKSYYNLSIDRSNPILFFNRPFNQLSANIYGRNSQHYIRSASAEFADGLLVFDADILDTSNEDPQLRIDLSLTDCNYSQSIKDAFQNEFENTSFNESSPLSLDLTLKSKGSLLDLTEHNGYGSITVKGSDLGKIHLLGPLSKALDELNLSIGVFSLNQLESDFLIQKEWINVPNLEINGEQSYVFGQGKILIPDQSINFKMKVDLFKNKNLSFSNLGSLGKILNPMTKIFNFNVTGTLQDQKWLSVFDPRNLFQ